MLAGGGNPARYSVVSDIDGVKWISFVDRSTAMDVCSSLNEDEMFHGGYRRWEVIFEE